MTPMRTLGLLVALCAVAVSGQSDICDKPKGHNITSQADLDALSACSTVTGNVEIRPDLTQANLQGVGKIKGDLVVEQATKMTSLSAPNLESISGKLRLVNLTILSSLSMPRLNSVGSIDFTILNALQAVDFAGITSADDVLITDTQLSSLVGINLSKVNSFNINNNFFLKNVSQPKLSVVKGALSIAFNADSVAVDFPKLQTMQNGTFRQVGSVNLPALNNVSGDLGFLQNSFEHLSLPNLTSVLSSYSLVNNSALTNVSAPKLKSIGGAFLIANNTKYDDIVFDKVESVGGAVDWTGSFSKASMSSLSDVRGGFNVQSSSKSFDCPFSELRTNGVVKGNTFVCTGDVDNPTGGVNGTNSTANSGSSGKSKSNDAAQFSGPIFFIVGTCVFATAISML